MNRWKHWIDRSGDTTTIRTSGRCISVLHWALVSGFAVAALSACTQPASSSGRQRQDNVAEVAKAADDECDNQDTNQVRNAVEARVTAVDSDLPRGEPSRIGNEAIVSRARAHSGLSYNYRTGRPDRSATLNVHYLYKKNSRAYASDVLLADTRLLFGLGEFPSEVVHPYVVNTQTRAILAEHVPAGRTVTFDAFHPIFSALVNTCGTNGNAMLHYVQDASVIDPDYTFFIAEIVVKPMRLGYHITFKIGRRGEGVEPSCNATIPGSPKPPPPPPGGEYQGCCFGAALDVSPGYEGY